MTPSEMTDPFPELLRRLLVLGSPRQFIVLTGGMDVQIHARLLPGAPEGACQPCGMSGGGPLHTFKEFKNVAPTRYPTQASLSSLCSAKLAHSKSAQMQVDVQI